jgi:hypothetical protein
MSVNAMSCEKDVATRIEAATYDATDDAARATYDATDDATRAAIRDALEGI